MLLLASEAHGDAPTCISFIVLRVRCFCGPAILIADFLVSAHASPSRRAARRTRPIRRRLGEQIGESELDERVASS